jgi:hypothetical protein
MGGSTVLAYPQTKISSLHSTPSTLTVFLALVCLPRISWVPVFLTTGHTATERMRTFTFSLLAVLNCIAMIGATPIWNRALAGAINRRQLYVPWRKFMEVLTRLKHSSSSPSVPPTPSPTLTLTLSSPSVPLPTLTLSSPSVPLSSPCPTLSSPSVTLSSPTLTQSSPSVPLSSPCLTLSSPSVPLPSHGHSLPSHH